MAVQGCGLDLGSSPGGWTQALRGGGPGTLSSSGLAATSRCLSLDKVPYPHPTPSLLLPLPLPLPPPLPPPLRLPLFLKGPMAARVLRLGGGTHVPLDFTSLEAAHAIAAAAPFSCVVCDANRVNPPGCDDDGLETIVTILSRAAEIRGCAVHQLLTSPCCLVLTLKFA